jgi:hypothetical protein
MKFVYMQSHCSVALLNETFKPEMKLLKQLYVLIMRSKYLALQVIKLVNSHTLYIKLYRRWSGNMTYDK